MRTLLASVALCTIGCGGPLAMRHCVALDIESDWGAPLGVGLGATSTGLGTMAALEKEPNRNLKVAAILTGAAGLVTTGVGMYASKSWHEQCQPMKATP
jgi:hypothetical protein